MARKSFVLHFAEWGRAMSRRFWADKQMHVDAILGLMRIAQTGDRLVPNLADVVLNLIEKLRAFEARAGLAEAQLENERGKGAGLQMTIFNLRIDQHERLVA